MNNLWSSFLAYNKGGTSDAAKDTSSSDEDEPHTDYRGSEEYIKVGERGIIVYRVNCLKTSSVKYFHINLYNGVIYQFVGTKRKKFNCSDILNITLLQEGNVLVDMRKPSHVATGHKRFLFNSKDDAISFIHYVEFRNDMGNYVRSAFDSITKTVHSKGQSTGIITKTALSAALNMVDIAFTEEELDAMLKLPFGHNNGDIFDFHSFFHLFIDSAVTTLRECLEEWLYQASNTLKTKPFEDFTNYIPGEILINSIHKIRWSISSNKGVGIPGSIYVTNYRIILANARKSRQGKARVHTQFDIPSFFNVMTIPLSTIFKIQLIQSKNIILHTKDTRVYRITLSQPDMFSSKSESLVQTIQQIAFRQQGSNPSTLFFAYKYRKTFNYEGWMLSDIMRDYTRQGLASSSEWKIYDNSDWKFADTYPKYLAVPAIMTDSDVKEAASFRSKNRLPVITYKSGYSNAVLTRSAQPLVGITLRNSTFDEILLNLYRVKGVSNPAIEAERPTKFYILDARPATAAYANTLQGKGTEDASSYKHTEMIFCNIDNIHEMRNSITKLSKALHHQLSPSDKDSGPNQWLSKLDESKWLHYLHLILMASILAAEKIHLEKSSVLIHCSDGWDRTPQICALTQIMLDPYYRTIEGLAVVIEKDWCSFGHKFQERCGHGEDERHRPDERSPVFIQFLDALYQMIIQFPNAFEYNELLLLFIADHFYSSLFGNFLGNTDRERHVDLEVKDKCQSIWSYVFDNFSTFQNKAFQAYASPIWPNPSVTKIVLWHRYFCRWNIECHPNTLSTEQYHDDWGNGYETSETYAQEHIPSSYHITAPGIKEECLRHQHANPLDR